MSNETDMEHAKEVMEEMVKLVDLRSNGRKVSVVIPWNHEALINAHRFITQNADKFIRSKNKYTKRYNEAAVYLVCETLLAVIFAVQANEDAMAKQKRGKV